MAVADKRELTHQLNTSQTGYELVLSPLLFALIGFGLDKVLGWTPILTIIFAIFGVVGAGTSAYLRYNHQMGVETAAATAVVSEKTAQRVAERDAKAQALADERAALEIELAKAQAEASGKAGEQVA